ncbi:MAG: dTDP-4-dehydrorhamnose 3,5-epimerase [Spirochaetota bacterium]|nr:dTDP-4-dehydrorhamnose 3,5-epimerase [Spirochaetota bacterium]
MPFEFKQLDIPDLILIDPRRFYDERGFFLETYKKTEFVKAGINHNFVQDNHSLSKRNVIRGLHYQLNPKPQGKLVRVIKGKVWDVAVDIRRDSSTYLKWVGVELSEENAKMLFIPPGFAHAFAAISDDVHLAYKCTDEYDPNLDTGIRWDDPEIAIKWPVDTPIVSDKDKELPFLKDADIFD